MVSTTDVLDQPAIFLSRTLSVSVHRAGEWERIRRVWSDLFEQCSDASFFVSPDWVEAWLDTFGESLNPEIAIFSDEGTVVGACILVSRTYWCGPIPVRRCFINTSGEKEGSPFIEFNTVVCRPGYETSVASALQRALQRRAWDEAAFDGFSAGAALDAIKSEFSSLTAESKVSTDYYIDLADLRERNVSYEAALGQKTRKHLRQNYRMYGEISTEVAATREQAFCYLDELAKFHQERWTAAGEPGAFASPKFIEFHRKLIALTFASGAIQMLRFTAADKTIGLMYNMICRGHLYFYQSGLAYSEDKRVRPGFVCIGKAVQHCLELPHIREFHLMATGEHYKQRMGTHAQPVEWLLVRKKNARYYAINSLRTIKGRVAGARKPEPPREAEADEAAAAG